MPRVETVEELQKFIKATPADKFCVDRRDGPNGQHCILGHLDATQGYLKYNKLIKEVTSLIDRATGWYSDKTKNHFRYTDGQTALACINNGEYGPMANSGRRFDKNIDGESIKARLLTFIDKLLAKKQAKKAIEEVEEEVEQKNLVETTVS
jgi:hypothetical protein